LILVQLFVVKNIYTFCRVFFKCLIEIMNMDIKKLRKREESKLFQSQRAVLDKFFVSNNRQNITSNSTK
jgi:hypothetical protein